jgi:hypothetical protein
MRLIGVAVGLAVSLALAPPAAQAQHHTIPWGERSVMYLDFDSATTVLRGAFADGRPSVVMALGRPRLSGDYIVGHVTSMLSPGTIEACASAGTPSGEA